MSVSHLLYQRMLVERPDVNQDAVGGHSPGYTAREGSAPCQVRSLTGTRTDARGKDSVLSTHRLYCDADKDIKAGDRVTVDTIQYDVLYVDDPHNLGQHLEVDMRLRQ